MNRISFSIRNLLPIVNKYDKSLTLFKKNSAHYYSTCSKTYLFQAFQKIKINTFTRLNAIIEHRSYSSDSDQDGKEKKSCGLMKFDPVLKPEVILSIKNWILTKLIIQPYLDSEFTIKDFTGGAKQALAIVSSLISQGDFQSLKGLVTDEAIQEIKTNFSSLNIKERQDLFIKVTDILFAFPYQIGIFFDDSECFCKKFQQHS